MLVTEYMCMCVCLCVHACVCISNVIASAPAADDCQLLSQIPKVHCLRNGRREGEEGRSQERGGEPREGGRGQERRGGGRGRKRGA